MQKLSVFLNLDTHEELSRLRRLGQYEDDEQLIRDALHALKREWQAAARGDTRGLGLPARSPAEQGDALFQRGSSYGPQDYDI